MKGSDPYSQPPPSTIESESDNLKRYTLNNAWFSTEAQTFLYNASLASCGCQEIPSVYSIYIWSSLHSPEHVPVTRQMITALIIINILWKKITSWVGVCSSNQNVYSSIVIIWWHLVERPALAENSVDFWVTNLYFGEWRNRFFK